MKLVPKVSSKEKVNPMKILKEKRKLMDKLSEDLEEKGVEFFRPVEQGGTLSIDAEYLRLPKDLTNATSQDLGKYLNAFTQQRMYMRTLIGWQQLAFEEMKRKYYDVSTPIYSELKKKDFPSETAKERYINNHPDVHDTFMLFKDEKRKMDLFQLNLFSIDDAIFLISREISRRNADFPVENRNENIQRR